MRAALYARVSTQNHHQDPEVQLRDLRAHCAIKGWEIAETYVDKGVSGTKESRPELNRLMADARLKKFDVVLVWKFDRFARSVSHLLRALDEFKSLEIPFVSTTEGIDTGTVVGKMVFTVLGAVAEMERSLTVERIRAGMRNAKAKGHVPGRRAAAFDLEEARARVQAGESERQVAKTLGISHGLLNKRLKTTAATKSTSQTQSAGATKAS
jgi:DNA invertase Pin-like site-specific DNA recombinase